MSRAGDQFRPRAMIHCQILDIAASRPDVSYTAIADEVSGATPSLVERVLDEYGDPGDDGQDDGSQSDTGAESGQSQAPADTAANGDVVNEAPESPSEQGPQATEATPESLGSEDDDRTDGLQGDGATDETDNTSDTMTSSSTQTNGSVDGQTTDLALSEKQGETLHAVYDRPEATQEELAEQLGVTRATISRRLNAIPGFEWSDRRAFVAAVFEGDGTAAADETPAADETEAVGAAAAGAVDETVDAEPDDATDTADGASDGDDEASDPASGAALRRLDERLTALEDGDTARADDASTDRDEASSDRDEAATATVSLTPELAHKVLSACMESERITDDEEVELVRSLVRD